jgi:hypothetical protein
MKIKLLAAVLMLAISTATAQDCKIEKDAFTGDQTVTFSYKNESLVYKLVRDTATLQIKFNYAGEFNTVVPAGTEFLLKSSTDEIIKLASSKPAYPVSSISGTSIISQYQYNINVGKEQLTAITKSQLVMMRHPDGKGGTTDFEFKGFGKKWGKALLGGAECILSNMK